MHGGRRLVLGGVHHLAVRVTDLARAEAFYGGVLGLALKARHPDAAGQPRSLWYDLPLGGFLAVERAGAGGPRREAEAPGWHAVILGIAPEARRAWKAHLAASGVTVTHETEYTVYFSDAEDNLLGLSHHPHPQESSSEESSWR